MSYFSIRKHGDRMRNKGKYSCYVDVYTSKSEKGSLGEDTIINAKIKSIWCRIVPRIGSMIKSNADTISANISHDIITRYSSGKEISQSAYFMYKNKRYDIKYILNPYELNETLEFKCNLRVE